MRVHAAQKQGGRAMLRVLLAAVVGALAAGCVSAAAGGTVTAVAARQDTTITAAARSAVVALDAHYDPATGDRLITIDDPWTGANELAAMTTADATLGTDHRAEYATLYDHYRWGSFQNSYFDDTAWWVLAWLDAYHETHVARYLTLAETMTGFLQSGWSGVCGGGSAWATPIIQGAGQKNSITNELDLQVYSELYTDTHQATYLTLATRQWTWLSGTGLIRRDGLVADHLDAHCRPTGVIWSYTQGQMLTAITAYQRAASRSDLTALGIRLADASTTYRGLHPHGILTEPCELGNSCNLDGPLLKGCYVRALAAFSATVGDRYTPYLRLQAHTMLADDREPGDLYGPRWAGPASGASTPQQVAAIDLLTAAAR